MWYGVDPLIEDYPAWSPFNYVMGNPIRLIDPTGMGAEGADDIIIRSQDKNGTFKELARIETDMFNITFDIDAAILSDYDMAKVDPLCIDQCEFENTGLTNPQAISFNISGEAAYKVGAQVELSIIGMIGGPQKGEWGVAIQGNGLIGLDASVTGSMSVYAPMDGNNDLFLNDLRGMEYGVQGDGLYQAGSYFRGTGFTTSFPYMRNTYKGYSLGMSFGPLPGGASAYFGVSDFIYTSIGGWFPGFKK